MVSGRIAAQQASAPPFSLLATAPIVVNGSDLDATLSDTQEPTRWVQGFAWDPEDCSGGSILDPCDDDTAPASATTPDDRTFQPYIVEASIECGTLGSAERRAELDARARRKLVAVRSAQIEAELWSGTQAQSHGWTANDYFLEATGAQILEAIPLGFQTALAELEQAIGDQSDWERGMIHAMPRTVAHWSANGLVHAEGDVLFTLQGTRVVSGRGYPGTGPTALQPQQEGPFSADFAWAYASGIVEVRLGSLSTRTTDAPQAGIALATNDMKLTAAQFAAATWSGCVLAAAWVDHTVALTDSGS